MDNLLAAATPLEAYEALGLGGKSNPPLQLQFFLMKKLKTFILESWFSWDSDGTLPQNSNKPYKDI